MRIVKLSSDRVNLVYSTDWHLSAVPPGRRTDNYKDSILTKVKFVRDLAIRLHGASICGGDVFHVKNPRSPANSLNLIFDTMSVLQSFPFGCVFGTPGNHDLTQDRTDSLPNQPLGLLIAAGVYHNTAVEPVLFVNEDESIKVLVESFDYADEETTLQRLLTASPRPEGIDHRLALVHAYGHPGNAGSMFGTRTIGYNELKDADYDFMCWGHDHSRHETEQVGNVTHINLGSLARAAYSHDEVERPVVATILSFAKDGVRYKEKEVPLKPLQVAFTTADRAVAKVADSEEVTSFLAEMDEQVSGIGESGETDPRKVMQELCADEPQLLSLAMELCSL